MPHTQPGEMAMQVDTWLQTHLTFPQKQEKKLFANDLAADYSLRVYNCPGVQQDAAGCCLYVALPGPLVFPWLKVALVNCMELLLTMTKPGRLVNCELSTDTFLGRFLKPRTRPASALSMQHVNGVAIRKL